LDTKYKLGIIVVLVVIVGAYMVLAAGSNSNKITIAGSTSVQPVAQKLADAYTKEHPNVKITVQGGGSSVGITDAEQGIVSIGASSENLTANDSAKLNQTIIGYDGIAVIVNKNNTAVSGLTSEQLAGIYTGNITNWNQVGGSDAKIDVITREQGSGTRTNFQKLVLNGSQVESSAIVQTSTQGVKSAVSGDPNAIGFISLTGLDSSVKAISVNGVGISVDNITNGTYNLQGPLMFLTKGTPKGTVQDFINWVLGPEGQAIVKSTNSVPVNSTK
jgi:phosphate transport system substrate-binding protein